MEKENICKYPLSNLHWDVVPGLLSHDQFLQILNNKIISNIIKIT